MRYAPLFLIACLLLGLACNKSNTCTTCITYGWTFDIDGKNYQSTTAYGFVWKPDSTSASVNGPGNNAKDSLFMGINLFFSPVKLDHSFSNLTVDSITFQMSIGITKGYSNYDYSTMKASIDSFNVFTHMIYGSFSGPLYAGPNAPSANLTNGRFIASVTGE
jgi:hypothetical protein